MKNEDKAIYNSLKADLVNVPAKSIRASWMLFKFKDSSPAAFKLYEEVLERLHKELLDEAA